MIGGKLKNGIEEIREKNVEREIDYRKKLKRG